MRGGVGAIQHGTNLRNWNLRTREKTLRMPMEPHHVEQVKRWLSQRSETFGSQRRSTTLDVPSMSSRGDTTGSSSFSLTSRDCNNRGPSTSTLTSERGGGGDLPSQVELLQAPATSFENNRALTSERGGWRPSQAEAPTTSDEYNLGRHLIAGEEAT